MPKCESGSKSFARQVEVQSLQARALQLVHDYTLMAQCSYDLESQFSDLLNLHLLCSCPGEERGRVYISRNRTTPHDIYFNLMFVPSDKDKESGGVIFVATTIARGKFNAKEIRFGRFNREPEYVNAEYLPCLQEIFSALGYSIVDELH